MLYFKTSSCTEYSHPPQCWCLLVSHYLKSSTTLTLEPSHPSAFTLCINRGQNWMVVRPGNLETRLHPYCFSILSLASFTDPLWKQEGLAHKAWLFTRLFIYMCFTNHKPTSSAGSAQGRYQERHCDTEGEGAEHPNLLPLSREHLLALAQLATVWNPRSHDCLLCNRYQLNYLVLLRIIPCIKIHDNNMKFGSIWLQMKRARH